MQEMLMFDVVNPETEESIIEYTRIPRSRKDKIEQLKSTNSQIRRDRVSQLKFLYLTRDGQEISPWEDGDNTANLDKFVEEYDAEPMES